MKYLAFFIVATIIGAGILIFFFSQKEDDLSDLNTGITSMKTLDASVYRFPEQVYLKGLNFIFYADQYSSWEEFDNDIESIMSKVRKVEPWVSYNQYNIYKIKPEDAEGVCWIKVKDERKPTLRCREEINQYLNNIPVERFKLVVLSRQNFQSWANVVRIENSGIFFSVPRPILTSTDEKTYGILFLHMLGHAFGLKDEENFVIAQHDSAVLVPDGPNCAPNLVTAEKWWGDLAKESDDIGYFNGCSGSEDYIRPTRSSLMNLNDLSDFVATYGAVSERYLNNVLNICFSEDAIENKEFLSRYSEFKVCK